MDELIQQNMGAQLQSRPESGTATVDNSNYINRELACRAELDPRHKLSSPETHTFAGDLCRGCMRPRCESVRDGEMRSLRECGEVRIIVVAMRSQGK